jgi:hypothetical protein
MDKFWKWLTVLLLCFLAVAVLTHAYGFSLAAGTLFTGLNSLGTSLEAGGISSGGTAVQPAKAA